MVLPELPLLLRASCGVSCTAGVGVIRQREILPDHSDLIAVFRYNLVDNRRDLPTIWALKLRALRAANGGPCCADSLRGIVWSRVDGATRWSKANQHTSPSPQFRNVRPSRLPHLLKLKHRSYSRLGFFV